MPAAFLSFAGLDLHFDAVTSEQVSMTATATESPVESGANVSDHIIDELDTVSLELFITNQPIRDVNGVYGLDANFIEFLDIGSTESVIAGNKLDVPTYRPFPVTPGALLQTIGNAFADALSDDQVAQLYGQTQPKRVTAAAQVQNWPTKFNAITDTVGLLNDWKKRGVIGSVITPWKTFPSVAIVGISPTRTPEIGDAATVVLTLKEIRLVESKTVTAPIPTEPRGKTMIAKGRQPTTVIREPAAPQKSWLKKATEKKP
jgi:hypothetical protein